MVFFELRSRISHYFIFTRRELRDLLIVVLVIGFTFSFCDWGPSGSCTTQDFNFFVGLGNLILLLIIAGLSVGVHESAHRILALSIGMKSEFRIWWGGLISSIIIVFATSSFLPRPISLILPGGVVNAIIVRQRLGEFRYGTKYWDNGIIALYGPLANLALAALAKLMLSFAPQSWFLQKLVFVNVIFAICTMLPFPQLDGISVLFAGRLLYVITFFAITGIGILMSLQQLPLLTAVVGGIFITIIATFIYYIKIENVPT